MHPEERLRSLGLTLPAPPPPLAHYALAVRSGRLLFLAGHAPLWDGQFQFVGKVGREWTIEPARFRSKARNTPFAGWPCVGGPWMTIVGGTVVMRDGTVEAGPGR